MVNPSACIIPPEIIGIPAEQSCTPIAVGQLFTSQLIAINDCGPNVTVIDIGTLPFAGVNQGNIIKQNSTTYYKSFSWTPTAAQLGYQIMCAMAYDRYVTRIPRMKNMNDFEIFSQYSQSSQYCFKFYVAQSASSGCPSEIINTTTIATTMSTTTVTTTMMITMTTTTMTITMTTTTMTITMTTTTVTTTETLVDIHIHTVNLMIDYVYLRTTPSNSPTTDTTSTITYVFNSVNKRKPYILHLI